MKTRNISLKTLKLEENTSKSILSEESFLKSAFQENIHVAESVLNTNYLTGIWKGILPPDYYGIMTVQDSYYCYMAVDTLKMVLDKSATDKDLHTLVEKIYNEYVIYNQDFAEKWRIEDTSSIKPIDVIKNYADYEREVAQTEAPLYALVAMLPCFYLWYWFSDQMLSQGVAEDNLYLEWIKSCYNYSSAKAVDDFITKWRGQGKEFDVTKAKEIFKTSMVHELNVFSYLYEDAPKEDMIVDLLVIQGNSASIEPPEGYVKIPQDTNEGAGGKYIYICYKKGPIQQAITDIYVTAGDSSSVFVPDGYTKIDKDLNKGAGGKYIYLCYRRVMNTPIKDITLIKGTDSNIKPPMGYERLAQDLNQGAGGKYIYVCIKR